jgi:hypothetical protein
MPGCNPEAILTGDDVLCLTFGSSRIDIMTPTITTYRPLLTSTRVSLATAMVAVASSLYLIGGSPSVTAAPNESAASVTTACVQGADDQYSVDASSRLATPMQSVQ